MANYTVISEVGTALVKLLRDHMVPGEVLNPESIGLCSPEDKGDIMVGLYLYDIRECEEVRRSTMVNVDSRSQKYPSTFLSLYYMITAYSNGDVKFRSAEEQKLLGRVVQILSDHSLLDASTYVPITKDNDYALNIELLQMSMEEKQKVWSVPNKAYKLSLFYRVAPVELESSKTKDVQRVVDMDIIVKE
ncbi:MAG TPA: DUF4255 domain-containing protein [Clostridiales bacterium]|nr:DUF4255 domain-containing protein [Clostridiales bacterium]